MCGNDLVDHALPEIVIRDEESQEFVHPYRAETIGLVKPLRDIKIMLSEYELGIC